MSYQDIISRVAAATEASGRKTDDIRLIVVSKVQPEERVRAVLDQVTAFTARIGPGGSGSVGHTLPDYPGTELHP